MDPHERRILIDLYRNVENTILARRAIESTSQLLGRDAKMEIERELDRVRQRIAEMKGQA